MWREVMGSRDTGTETALQGVLNPGHADFPLWSQGFRWSPVGADGRLRLQGAGVRRGAETGLLLTPPQQQTVHRSWALLGARDPWPWGGTCQESGSERQGGYIKAPRHHPSCSSAVHSKTALLQQGRGHLCHLLVQHRAAAQVMEGHCRGEALQQMGQWKGPSQPGLPGSVRSL